MDKSGIECVDNEGQASVSEVLPDDSRARGATLAGHIERFFSVQGRYDASRAAIDLGLCVEGDFSESVSPPSNSSDSPSAPPNTISRAEIDGDYWKAYDIAERNGMKNDARGYRVVAISLIGPRGAPY